MPALLGHGCQFLGLGWGQTQHGPRGKAFLGSRRLQGISWPTLSHRVLPSCDVVRLFEELGDRFVKMQALQETTTLS